MLPVNRWHSRGVWSGSAQQQARWAAYGSCAQGEAASRYTGVYDHGGGWAGQFYQEKISIDMDRDMGMKTRSADAKDIHAVQVQSAAAFGCVCHPSAWCWHQPVCAATCPKPPAGSSMSVLGLLVTHEQATVARSFALPLTFHTPCCAVLCSAVPVVPRRYQ